MKQFNILLIAATLLLASCNDDEGGGNPPSTPSGTITASTTNNLGVENPNWSLPVVTARMSFFNLTFTARNSDTGEMLILNMANNGEGTYYSEMLDVTVGGGNYFANSDAKAQVSLIAQETAFMLVDVTSIDTISKLIDATFSVWVYSSDTANAPYTIFQNGVLDNVPYTGGPDDVIFGGNSTLTATINDEPYQAEFITTFDQFLAVQTVTGTLAGQALNITLPYTLRDGTYSLTIDEEDLEAGVFASVGEGTEVAIASEGTITFTRDFVDQTINGTFSFFAPNLFGGEDFTVTNGVMNVRY